jgi:Haem-binding domain
MYLGTVKLGQHDVQKGRRKLNLSDWAASDQRRATRKLKEICEQVEKGAMPTMAYLWLRPRAKLSEADRQAICDWTRTEPPAQPSHDRAGVVPQSRCYI